MPLIETKGAASAQGFGEFATSSEKLYIESCFSTYLYTGNGSTQTITNGIDLSGKGGLVWVKCRSIARDNILGDSERIGTNGGTRRLISNSTAAQSSTSITTFFLNSSGFQTNGGDQDYNGSGETYASWSFRKQAKFFDIVTYTGNGSNRTISHNLGSVPGCIIVKRTDTTADWQVYHRSIANTEYLVLNTTAAKATGATRWNSTTPTSTVFSLGTDTTVNANGGTYVAYIFAHDAGGFGLSGTDNVISCGSYTGNGSTTGPVIDLGWEPQWLLVRAATTTQDWYIIDTMRGMTNGTSPTALLQPNTSNAETGAGGALIQPAATGFSPTSSSGRVNGAGQTYIYIAIRRGPMKVPTSGTSVFAPVIGVSSSSAPYMTNLTSFTVDAQLMGSRTSVENKYESSRLQGTGKILYTNTTDAEVTGDYPAWDRQTGVGSNVGLSNFSAYITYNFQRAPGFFDVVCWTGVAGTAQQINHNLSSVPEMIITKRRDAISGWIVYASSVGATKYLTLHNANAPTTSSLAWNDTTPTSTVFTAGQTVSPTGGTIVAYLFATVAGVSKVGSYTGSGTTKQIDCGFTAGARFVLIKRTDSTGNWLVADSARGIVAGNDPLLYLNSTAAEITTLDWIDADSSGFIVNQEATANANVSSATYIYFAVA